MFHIKPLQINNVQLNNVLNPHTSKVSHYTLINHIIDKKLLISKRRIGILKKYLNMVKIVRVCDFLTVWSATYMISTGSQI